MPTWSQREIERLCELMAMDCDFDEAAILLCRGMAEVRDMWERLVRALNA